MHIFEEVMRLWIIPQAMEAFSDLEQISCSIERLMRRLWRDNVVFIHLLSSVTREKCEPCCEEKCFVIEMKNRQQCVLFLRIYHAVPTRIHRVQLTPGIRHQIVVEHSLEKVSRPSTAELSHQIDIADNPDDVRIMLAAIL